jgi:hypothetical protein
MQVTNEQLVNFFINAKAILQKSAGKKSRMLYSLQRMYDKCLPLIKKYNKKDEDLRAQYARTDSESAFIMTEQGDKLDYTFTKDKLKEMNAAREKLTEDKVEIEPHVVPSINDVPSDYSNLLIQALTPFVISEEMRDQLIYSEPAEGAQ